MKKVFTLEGLDCANCAQKMETAITKIDGVTNVNINFLTQKMSFEAPEENFNALLKQAQKTMKRVDRHVSLA